MPTSTQLAQARQTLIQAMSELGVSCTDDASYWLLGLVAGESNFGQSVDWTSPNELNPSGMSAPTAGGAGNGQLGASNNWGAVRYHKGDGLWIWHHDRDQNGTLGTYKFQAYVSQDEGAKGFLRVLLRGAVPAIVSTEGTSPHDLAAAMYANHYYTGTTGSADDRINAYAAMISSHASSIRKALGAQPPPPPPAPGVQPAPPGAPQFFPGPTPPATSGFAQAPWLSSLGVPLLVVAAAIGGAWYLHKRRMFAFRLV